MRVLSEGSVRGSTVRAPVMPRLQPEPEVYTEMDFIAAQSTAPPRSTAGRRKPSPVTSSTLLTVAWVLAIAFFGFGDTLTSIMVFGAGGGEGNGFMVLALTLLSKTFGGLPAIMGFAAIKLVSTATVVVTAQYQPKLQWPAGLAMLAMGIFLVVQNSTVLLALH